MSDPMDTSGQRNWNSVRTLIEAAILAALLWASSVLTQTQTQIAVLQTDIANLRVQLAPLAQLDQRVTRLEVMVDRRAER